MTHSFRNRWSRRRLVGLVLVSIAMIVVLRGCFFRPATNFSGVHFNRGANALWLGVEWVNEPHDESEIIALADDLQRRQIRDVYVFVSFLRADGEFNSTFSHAAEFIRVLKTAQPDSNVQAWIGLPLAQSGLFSSGYVDLGDPATRQKVAAFCADIVRDARFDGVHLDPEPVPSGDTDVLTLLEQVRSAIGVTRTLSMATRRILPIFSDSRLPLIGQTAWRASYYREIALRVDQIAVMTYDSAMPLSSLYRQWVRFQVIEISRVVDGTDVELLIGLPTYKRPALTGRLRNTLPVACKV